MGKRVLQNSCREAHPESNKTRFENTSRSRIGKQDFRNVMPNCFQMQENSLKPMDSFGTWRKWKLVYIFLLMHNIIEVAELLMPC